MKETFAAALRAEIEAVVMRYEALVASQRETAALAGSRETEALRTQIAAARAERDALSRELEEARTRIRSLEEEARAGAAAARALDEARERIHALEEEARAGALAARTLEEQFAVERRFAEACTAVAGTMLADALRASLGREIEANPSSYAALKSKGLESLLIQAFKDRGRSVAQAPLLEREKGQLAALASAAGCELVTPEHGARFSQSSMDKAATVSDPAEEGNVVECLLPGLRRAGTEGALVFPRVRVATG